MRAWENDRKGVKKEFNLNIYFSLYIQFSGVDKNYFNQIWNYEKDRDVILPPL